MGRPLRPSTVPPLPNVPPCNVPTSRWAIINCDLSASPADFCPNFERITRLGNIVDAQDSRAFLNRDECGHDTRDKPFMRCPSK